MLFFQRPLFYSLCLYFLLNSSLGISFICYSIFFFSKAKKERDSDFCSPLKKIGDIDPNEQAILVDWYNSLTSKGSLGWNVSIELCGQTGVECEGSTPRRIIRLYFLFFLFCPFFSFRIL